MAGGMFKSVESTGLLVPDLLSKAFLCDTLQPSGQICEHPSQY